MVQVGNLNENGEYDLPVEPPEVPLVNDPEESADDMPSDDMPNEAETDEYYSGIYESLSKIEFDLKDGDTRHNRIDNFALLFESAFNLSIDQVDDIESLLMEKSGDEQEMLLNVYSIIRDGVVHFLDLYWGVEFNYDGVNSKPDLNNAYSCYRVFFTDILNWVAKVFAYLISKYPSDYNDFFEDKNRFFDDIVNDTYRFNLDSIPSILSIMDPGNADYIYVFGKIPDDVGDDGMYLNPDVGIDWSVFTKRLMREINLGNSVANREYLRERINHYLEYIKENKIA